MGSINVITINMNRFAQDGRYLTLEIEKIHKYQVAYLEIMNDYLKQGMLSVFNAGFINLDRQFLAIGINGMCEAAESMGITVGNNTDYKHYVSKQLK